MRDAVSVAATRCSHNTRKRHEPVRWPHLCNVDDQRRGDPSDANVRRTL